jgi:4-amino-4-deoxy-L-arabinose transferase-like glycosyltransferase
MIADLIGYIAIGLIFIVTFLMALRWSDISSILFIAFGIRFTFLLVGHYIYALPDSGADAKSFENFAWFLAQDGFINVLNNYKGPDSFFISWLVALPYSLFGRSLLMAKSISLFFGMGCIFLGYVVSKKIWDTRTAKKVCLIIALFPSLVLYSVSFLREIYVCFFLLVALYGIVSWTKNNNFKSVILTMIGFIGATFFHGAMIIGAIVFIMIVGIISLIKLFKSLNKGRVNPKTLFVFLLILIITAFYLLNKIVVPKLGNIENMLNIENLLKNTKNFTTGDASYPEWTISKSPIELFYKGPIRTIYFIFSPFPWDIKKIYHLVGFFDSILYMYLVFLILKNRKVIWKDPALRIILIILLCYIFVFGVAIGNFGTGIRHRSKFVIMFILLAAPLIPKFILFKRNKQETNQIR